MRYSYDSRPYPEEAWLEIIASIGRGPNAWWPSKLPGSVVLRGTALTNVLTNEQIAELSAISVVASPSGSGELSLNTISIGAGSVWVGISGGQPTRVYQIMFTATISDGSIVQWIVKQGITLYQPWNKPQIAPVPGFGDPLVWGAGNSLDFSNPLNSGFIPLIWGF